MLKWEQIAENRNRIIELLIGTNRAGVMLLLEYLDDVGFFDSPASTKYHGSYQGGLAQHSLNVFGKVVQLSSECGLELPADSVTIACLLHDLCKAGAYVKPPEGGTTYLYNKDHPKGHARLSLERLDNVIALTYLERRMIQFHMGLYGTTAHSNRGEYAVENLIEALETPAVKLMTFADELVTLEEMTEEREHIELHGTLEAVA